MGWMRWVGSKDMANGEVFALFIDNSTRHSNTGIDLYINHRY